jgi:hypothetical protein
MIGVKLDHDSIDPQSAKLIRDVCDHTRFGFTSWTPPDECKASVRGIARKTGAHINISSASVQLNVPRPMDGVDLLVDWEALKGRRVTVNTCQLGRSLMTKEIACAVRGSGILRVGTIWLDQRTMHRESLRRALKQCSSIGTGPDCSVSVLGVVSESEMGGEPGMRNAIIVWAQLK